MPAPNAMLSDSPRAQSGASSLANDKNRVDQVRLVADPYAGRTPEYYIGIFNVSKTELQIARSWVPNGTVKLRAREEGQLYGLPFILNDVVPIPKPPMGNDEIILVPTKGEFLAQDIVNCNDPYGSWKTYRPLNAATATNEGNNYYDRGIFWCRLTSPGAEPDFDAVEFAIKRLETYYQNLIQEANLYYTSGPKEQSKICQPHHEAADYFIESGVKLSLPWHQVLSGNLHEQLQKARAGK
jgi:hypothetical protein